MSQEVVNSERKKHHEAYFNAAYSDFASRGRFVEPHSMNETIRRKGEIKEKIAVLSQSLKQRKVSEFPDYPSYHAWRKRCNTALFFARMEHNFLVKHMQVTDAIEKYGKSPYDIFGSKLA